MKTAKFIKSLSEGTGTDCDIRLYRLSEPEPTTHSSYVMVSAHLGKYVEKITSIFQADEHGTNTHWNELSEPLLGVHDHELALLKMGYIIK